MVYVSKSVQGMYLSLETMINLGILGSGFPNIGKADEGTMEQHQRPEPADTLTRYELPSYNATRQVNDGCLAPRDFNGDSCPCLNALSHHHAQAPSRSIACLKTTAA